MKTLLIVDVQNDFLPGGNLPVPKGHEVIPVINSIMPRYDLIVASKDYHPHDHKSFASQHKNSKPGEIILLNGIKQTLWPDHCIKNSFGSDIVSSIKKEYINHIIYKGTNKEIDSYSAFFDNNKTPTSLDKYLSNKKVKTLDVVGLATDYCVKYTVLDALNLGYKVNLIINGCRGINLEKNDIETALQEMTEQGCNII